MSITDCFSYLNLDIVGVAETHLSPHDSLEIDGYKWYSHPRQSKHRHAKCFSGGVGFLVKNTIFDSFQVNLLNDSEIDILWLKLTNIKNPEI